MIFLCFSVKDRIPIINDFYHFLSNFGVDVWYDRRNIFLGDHRFDTNIKNGAECKDVKYAVVFYSDNFKNGNICLDEFNILVNRYEKREVFIFPVFLSEVPEHIDSRFGLCKTLVYKMIHNQSDFPALALHIIAKITSDEAKKTAYQKIDEVQLVQDSTGILLSQLLVEYQQIEKTNYNMRIAFLFSLFEVLSNAKETSYFHKKTMNFIFHQNCIGVLANEKRELQIMENIILYESAYL